MVVKYNSLNKIENPVLTLCNPGSVYNDGALSNVVGILTNHESEELIFNFNSTSELNFRINSVSSDSASDDEHLKNMFDSVKNKRLIFMEDVGYFVIDDVKDEYENGISYKDVSAKSVDVELQQRGVPYISEGTYPFSTQGQTKGILQTVVETLPLWTIGEVDNSIANKYRTFDDIDPAQNCLGFLINEVQEAYECIILFDITNRTINVYDQSNYVHQTNVHITKNDLINSCKVTEQSDDLYTAITAIGESDIVISAINPLGTNTIYNFNYYLDWMSSELKTKVINWQNLVQSQLQPYYNKQLQYYTKMDQASNLEMDIGKIDTQLSMYEACYRNIGSPDGAKYVADYNEVIVANGGTPITIRTEVEQMQAQINNLIAQCKTQKTSKQSQLNTVQSSMATLQTEINAIRTQVSFDSNFTNAELEELQNYIFEGNYKDEYVVITDEMTNSDVFSQMKILYDRAEMQLDRVSQPTSEYEIDVESFIFAKEFEHAAEQLETGCLINVEIKDGDVAELFLSSIKVNYQDYNFSLTFGNRFNKFDPKTLFNKVLGSVSKSANSISYIKDILYPIKNGEVEKIYTAIKKSRDLTMASALASDNEEVIIDSSGYTGRSKNPEEIDGYDPEQIKITGKNIVFTDDRWETCKTAIGKLQIGSDPDDTVYGINAEVLMGDIIMGNELHIIDKQTGRDILTVVDGRISTQIQDNNTNYVDGHIADSATEVRTYADTQITQTADKITSEANARLEATVGYSSKNLLELSATTTTKSGIAFTVDKTAGTVTANGTCTASSYTTLTLGYVTNNTSTPLNLYMSGCADGGANDRYYLYAQDASVEPVARLKKWDGVTQSESVIDFTTSAEIQIPAGHTGRLLILVRTGITVTDIVFRPMIRIGSISDDTFEPYHSVQTQITETNSRIEQTADSITSEVSKKIRANVGYDDDNLIDFTNVNSTTKNGITFTVDKAKGCITANGTATADTSLDIPVTVVGNYYLSGGADGGEANKYFMYGRDSTIQGRVKKHDGVTRSDYLYDGVSGTEVKYVQGNTNRVRILIYNGQTVSNLVFSPALTEHKKLTTAVSETNSRITQTADSITLQVNDNLNRAASSDAVEYKMPTDITINYYGYGLTDEVTTDTGKKASDNNGKYYLDRKTGKVYKSNGSKWVENRTLPQKLDDYYTSSQANAAIEVSARGIKQTVGNSTSKYDTTGYDIDYYGLDLPIAAGYPASEHNGKFYLNQSTGFVYKSNGTSWSKQNSTALPLISTQLGSKIDQTAESITSTVGKATNTYDTTGYTIHYYGFGFKKNDDGTINYAITDSGNKASGNNNKYFLDQSTGYLYKSNNSVWAEPNPVVHFTPITTKLNSKIEQTADSITQTVSATYSTKDETTEKANAAQANAISAASTDATNKANAARNGANADTDAKLQNYYTTTEVNSKITQTAEKITSEATARLEATVGYSGKNILELTTSSKTQNGITFTVNKTDGTITVSGTATAQAGISFPFDIPSGDYYFSGCPSGGSASTYDLYAYDSDYSESGGGRPRKWDGTTRSDSDYGGTSQQIKIINGHRNNLTIRIQSGVDCDNLVFRPMIRISSITDATFEPYHSVQTQITDTNSRIEQTADSITSEVSRKLRANVGYDDTNLIDFTNVNSTTKNGITFTVDKAKGCITANGTATADTSLDIPVTVVGNYYLSGGADGGETNKYLMYGRDSTLRERVKKHDGVTRSDYLYDGVSGTEVKYVQGNTNRVRILIYNGQTVSNLVFSPAITEHKKVSAAISETNSKIVQTDSQIRSDVSATYTTKDESNEAVTELNSSIAQTAESIKQSVSGVMSKYDTSEVSYTITLFGIGTPPQAGYEASDYNGEYYLNQSNGEVYLSNGSSWGSPIKTLEMITTNLQTQITANANAISLKVSSDTFDSSIADVYDDISYTRQQLNSEIDVLPNEITLGVSQLVYGKPTKNLIPFVLEEKTYRGITCRREDDGSGYKLTGIATSNTCFSLYTTDASVSFTNSKLADKKTIANGNYIVNGEGFSSAIQYRVEKGIDSSTYSSLCKYSGETDGKPLNVTTDSSKPYIRHYIWIASGTDMGTDGVIVRPMIRDASIADSTYTPGIDSGKYMCSAISMTPEQIRLESGKLLITAGNFQLDGDGIVTMTGGVIKTSNYAAASGNTKTVGGKINLSATGSTPLFDTANFKVTGGGAVSAEDATFTNCSIVGGTFVVNSSVEQGEKESLISLKSAYTYYPHGGSTGVTEAYTSVMSPDNLTLTHKQKVDGSSATTFTTKVSSDGLLVYPQNDTVMFCAGVSNLGFWTSQSCTASTYSIYNQTGVVMKVGSYSTYGSTLMLGMSELPMRLCGNGTVVTNGDMNFIKYDSTDNISYGISLAGSVAFRLYNDEVSVGISSKKLRFYGTNVLLSNGTVVTSDERKKNSIELLDERYLNLIRMIEPKRFKYNANPLDRYHTGYIAQDVQTAMNKLNVSVDELSAFVDVNGDGSDLALRYGEFIPLLHKWLKELDNRVTAIEKRKE